jgi:putative ABC transport system substrate-binding protein
MAVGMKRRDLLTLLGTAAVILPRGAAAQPPGRRKFIGCLGAASPESASPQIAAFIEGLRDLGYQQGRDIDWVGRWASGRVDRLPALAVEVVALKPDIILAAPTPAVVAVKAVTSTIPIVSFMLADKVRLGLVANDAHPGGNVTGILMRVEGLSAKQFQIATEIVPGARRIAVLINPASVDALEQRRQVEIGGAISSVAIEFVEVRTPDDLVGAFQALMDGRAEALVVLYDALFFDERRRIAALVAAARIPAIYAARDHITEGGLISYGVSLSASARHLATYVDKILNGARPGDLPLEFPTRLEMVINLTAAKALGITLPQTLLVAADEVIE